MLWQRAIESGMQCNTELTYPRTEDHRATLIELWKSYTGVQPGTRRIQRGMPYQRLNVWSICIGCTTGLRRISYLNAHLRKRGQVRPEIQGKQMCTVNMNDWQIERAHKLSSARCTSGCLQGYGAVGLMITGQSTNIAVRCSRLSLKSDSVDLGIYLARYPRPAIAKLH